MAHFCVKTGARIAGPGLSDKVVLTSLDRHLAVQNLPRQPEVLEIDGVEMTVAEAEQRSKDAREPAKRTGRAQGGDA